ncbi:hypothetical protein [Bacillus sp. FJAT-26390]|uniref:hypothetical protein n=1 Tax=Bacillus sp. FJAT-26390 TaxID=1743142 RepID=UPI000807BA41|nr:hypothetical protein [Bacillus sp. FJAT-26390]OBZ17106.1 hypothetical protein A7975_04250 [Bacillus sp. FJAT-26390]
MATLALILKIIGAISEISGVVQIIASIRKKRRAGFGIGFIILIIGIILLVLATNIEDKIRAGYY